MDKSKSWRSLLVGWALVPILSLSFQASAEGGDEGGDDEGIQPIAKEVCACLKKPYAKLAELAEILETAKASGDFSKLMTMQDEVVGMTDAGTECFEKLEKKYPKIADDEEKIQKINAAADEICPNPAAEFAM